MTPQASAVDWDPPLEMSCIVLVDLPTAMAVRVLEVLKEAAPTVSVQRTNRSALRFSNNLSPGSLLILCDPCGALSAAAYLLRVREWGMSSPALILGMVGVPEVPTNEELEPVDAIALGDLDSLSFRRSLAAPLVAEVEMVGSPDGTYGGLVGMEALESGAVASAGGTADLDLNGSDLVGGFLTDDDEFPSSQFFPAAECQQAENNLEPRVRQLEKRLTVAGQERAVAEARLSDLRKHSVTRERELRRLRAQSATAGDLAQRLEASELLRREQTREMLHYQQQMDDLEERLETILSLSLVTSDAESETMEPAEMLEHLGECLRLFESERREQQGTINQLSRSLAVQQVDDALDNAQSRRNVLQRVEEVVRRTLKTNKPLTAMMIAIERPEEVRRRHGSVLYDFMLVQVAQRLQLALRRRDVLMRYGDEAFVLLTSVASAPAAWSHAERLQKAVGVTPLELGAQSFDLRVRIAIVAYHPEMQGANDLLHQALRLLMDAEAEDREQIVLSESFPPLERA
jgi:diguanylate cyclase (GGDEF)-like protein